MNKGMKKHVMRAAACFVTGSMLVGSSSMSAFAAGTSLVGVGTAAVKEADTKEEETKTEETKTEETEAAEETTEAAADTSSEETTEETEAAQDSMVGTIAVAQPGEETYFNIRANADANSEVVGYLYDSNCATILGEEGDWYYVQSGNCTGYVAKYLLTTGEAAAETINQVATPVAQVNAEALMVRSEPSEDADVVDTVTADQIVYLEEDLGGWAKISTGSTEGYVSADYVSYATYLPQGETQEEAEARIAEEEAAYQAWLDEQERLYQEQLAAEQAEWEAQNQAWIEYLQSQSDYADQAQAAADQAAADQAYAEQVAADAQAALDEAYSSGDEETIANAESYAQQTAQDAQTAADQAQAAQDEATAADQTVYDTVADAGIDTSEVTSTTDSSSSSLRQQIVDYALQFVGNPYVYGGTSLTNGTDCSGFTQSVLANFGININRTAGAQSQGGKSVDLSQLEPGDLLFYEGSGDYGIGHVTMYIGNGQVVHASSSTTGIIVSDVNYRTPVSASDYIG